REQDHQPTAIVVGGGPGDRRPADRPDRHRGDDQSLGEAAEVEVPLDEEQGAGDDAGVVAEEEAAEPGDRRGQDHIASRPPRGGLGPVHPARSLTAQFAEWKVLDPLRLSIEEAYLAPATGRDPVPPEAKGGWVSKVAQTSF